MVGEKVSVARARVRVAEFEAQPEAGVMTQLGIERFLGYSPVKPMSNPPPVSGFWEIIDEMGHVPPERALFDHALGLWQRVAGGVLSTAVLPDHPFMRVFTAWRGLASPWPDNLPITAREDGAIYGVRTWAQMDIFAKNNATLAKLRRTRVALLG